MKKAFVLCAIVGVAVYATTAWSASNKQDPTVARLVKDVATLKKQVKTLTKNLTTTDDVALSAFLFGVCSDEIAADELQGTWGVIDQISVALQAGKTYFGPQTPVTATLQGQDICAGGGVTRSQIVPPSVAPYQALLAPFHASDLRASALRLGTRFHLK